MLMYLMWRHTLERSSQYFVFSKKKMALNFYIYHRIKYVTLTFIGIPESGVLRHHGRHRIEVRLEEEESELHGAHRHYSCTPTKTISMNEEFHFGDTSSFCHSTSKFVLPHIPRIFCHSTTPGFIVQYDFQWVVTHFAYYLLRGKNS